MKDADELRNRVLNSAYRARAEGHSAFARALAHIASESLERATEMEVCDAHARDLPQQQPAPNQGQPQTDDPKKSE